MAFFCVFTGQGSELFRIDPIDGVIEVASCIQNCLDYESVRAYYLSVTASDNNGTGKKTVVNLRISVADANDNPPSFIQRNYKTSINEGEQKFEPPLLLKAEDLDESSVKLFRIVDGNTNNLFVLDRLSGEIKVRQRNGKREKKLVKFNFTKFFHKLLKKCIPYFFSRFAVR